MRWLSLIAFLVLIATAPAAQASRESSQGAPTGFMSYVAAGGLYRFYYPQTWKLADSTSGPSLKPSPDGSEAPQVRLRIQRADSCTISSRKFGSISFRFDGKLKQWQTSDEALPTAAASRTFPTSSRAYNKHASTSLP
jgi:hypothetical protein